MKEALDKSLAPSTWAQYNRTWGRYQEFANKVLLSPPVLPIPPVNILLFLAYLHKMDLTVSTLRSAGSAISYQHKMRGIPDPMEAYVVKKLFLGLASGEDNGDIRLPITRELLRKMVLAIPSMGFAQYKVILLQALFLTLFHGFLRIGEATSSPSASTPIQHSDISITNNAVTIVLRSFKHSKKPHRIDISGEMEGSICPVQALQRYVNLRGASPGPLFMTQADRPYLTTMARADLRSVLNFCDLDTGRYKSHSFRIGAASDAAQRGFSDAQIRLMGRWHSDAFRQYIRLPL